MSNDFGIAMSAQVGELVTTVQTSAGKGFTYRTSSMRDMVHRWNRLGSMIQHCTDARSGIENAITFNPYMLFQLEQAIQRLEVPTAQSVKYSQDALAKMSDRKVEALAVQMGLSVLQDDREFMAYEDNRGNGECLAVGEDKLTVIKSAIFRCVANRS